MWLFDTPHNNEIEGFISHICCEMETIEWPPNSLHLEAKGITSNHLIQFACFCEVEAIGQMAHFFHLCYEAKEMNKTQILMDKIFTLSWNFKMP
jgi:hypothetical protein